MNSVFRTYSFIVSHPLASRHKLRAIRNWVSWQVKCRIRKLPIEIPFVSPTRLIVYPGMHGATGNIYCGLHEFNDMSFLLHFLRPSDYFVDIGANVGTYSVLASGVCGAKTIAVEPVAKTVQALQENIKLNNLCDLVSIERIALGSTKGEVKISLSMDCTNHILRHDEIGEFERVSQKTLDALLSGRPISLLKIDVEGFEKFVLEGAISSLASKALIAIIIEVNGSGKSYGVKDDELYQFLKEFEFLPYFYDPINRQLTSISAKAGQSANQLFLREDKVDEVIERLRFGKKVRVMGEWI